MPQWKGLRDKLVRNLDHTAHRSTGNWESLACTQEVLAPSETRLKCKLSTNYSCTLMLIDVLVVEKEEVTVQDLIAALDAIDRHDVVNIIMEDARTSTQTLTTLKDWSSNCDLIEKIAPLLDEKSEIKQYWTHVGRKFKLSSEKLEEIDNCGQFNPTKSLMEYLYAEQKDLTVGRFYETVKKMRRPRRDVLEILKPFLDVENRDKPMEDVIGLEFDCMRKICVALNKENPALDNWRNVANAFSIDKDVYKDFNPEEHKSPTEQLFEWISVHRTQLTVGQLCAALKSIGRNDAVRDLRNYFEEHHTGN